MGKKKKNGFSLLRFIVRWLKNSIIYMLIMTIGIVYYAYTPLSDMVHWLVGFMAVGVVSYLVISNVRERLRF